MELNTCFGERYKVETLIGKGAFGSVYSGVDLTTRTPVAIKVEDRSNPHQLLANEGKILMQLQGEKGIPRVYRQGSHGEQNFIVMDLLGPSLQKLFKRSCSKFNLKTTLMLAYQMIQLIEKVHSKRYIHRDIKPDNFLIGIGAAGATIHLIDFGIAKSYVDEVTRKHIPHKEGNPLIGTVRYASIPAHNGMELGRRDDLESLCYVLLYFLNGALPWERVLEDDKEKKYDIIKQLKVMRDSNFLCKQLPNEMKKMIDYCKGLKFEENPDYDLLYGLIFSMAENLNIALDFKFSWLDYSVAESVKPIQYMKHTDQQKQELISKAVNPPYESDPKIANKKKEEVAKSKNQSTKVSQVSNEGKGPAVAMEDAKEDEKPKHIPRGKIRDNHEPMQLGNVPYESQNHKKPRESEIANKGFHKNLLHEPQGKATREQEQLAKHYTPVLKNSKQADEHEENKKSRKVEEEIRDKARKNAQKNANEEIKHAKISKNPIYSKPPKDKRTDRNTTPIKNDKLNKRVYGNNRGKTDECLVSNGVKLSSKHGRDPNLVQDDDLPVRGNGYAAPQPTSLIMSDFTRGNPIKEVEAYKRKAEERRRHEDSQWRQNAVYQESRFEQDNEKPFQLTRGFPLAYQYPSVVYNGIPNVSYSQQPNNAGAHKQKKREAVQKQSAKKDAVAQEAALNSRLQQQRQNNSHQAYFNQWH